MMNALISFVLLLLLASSAIAQPTLVNRPFPHKKEIRDSSDNWVVIHYDEGKKTNSTFRYLRRKRASYHYFIERTGKIIKLVDPQYVANHAGLSLYEGIMRWNKHSIGVCLQNDGKSSYTDDQYNSLNWLINQLHSRYLDLWEVKLVGHSDVAWPAGRKTDPGPLFEWARIQPLKYLSVVVNISDTNYVRNR